MIGGGSGRCKCVQKQFCPGRPGTDNGHGHGHIGPGGNGEYVDPGLITGSGPGGSNPEIDGTGNIDIRIVNRVISTFYYSSLRE